MMPVVRWRFIAILGLLVLGPQVVFGPLAAWGQAPSTSQPANIQPANTQPVNVQPSETQSVDSQESETQSTETADTEVSKLSIESLFHPSESIDYFGPFPPSTKWLADSRLAVDRGERWEVLDPASGEKSDWQWPSQLRDELSKLTGFSKKDLDRAAKATALKVENLDHPVLVEIGSALIVVGGSDQPKLVTRDSRAWKTPALSPDGSAVAFVQDHDLFVVKVISGEILRLTQSGSEDRLNGRLDWTYQEEIYGRGNFKGFWWSPLAIRRVVERW
jgi:dipeptidyl-peptidase 4